VVRRRGV